ncbi:hypothetical protein O3P69_004677 [Scylla paramamosain]|uniref:Reverse transcriptase RNase H-like domain-containing protein n=1 Tax=Scylla paramamosain TaxID=85552 RepID=A0AAW0UG46_SCYPA
MEHLRQAARLLAPLHKLLKRVKKHSPKPLEWGSSADEAFRAVKYQFFALPRLEYPVLTQRLCWLPTPWRKLQQEVAGVLRPVAFFSKRLEPVKRSYSAFDRELLAVYEAKTGVVTNEEGYTGVGPLISGLSDRQGPPPPVTHPHAHGPLPHGLHLVFHTQASTGSGPCRPPVGAVSHFGAPVTIITDQGVQFESRAWGDLLAFLETVRQRTTAYHSQANAGWRLSIILLTLRATEKEDIHHTLAEVVYGEDLSLTGQFVAPGDGGHSLSFLPALRTDTVTGPLQPPYSGPYQVLDRGDKHVTLDVRGRRYVTFRDRVKAARLPTDHDTHQPSPASTPWSAALLGPVLHLPQLRLVGLPQLRRPEGAARDRIRGQESNGVSQTPIAPPLLPVSLPLPPPLFSRPPLLPFLGTTPLSPLRRPFRHYYSLSLRRPSSHRLHPRPAFLYRRATHLHPALQCARFPRKRTRGIRHC